MRMRDETRREAFGIGLAEEVLADAPRWLVAMCARSYYSAEGAAADLATVAEWLGERDANLRLVRRITTTVVTVHDEEEQR